MSGTATQGGASTPPVPGTAPPGWEGTSAAPGTAPPGRVGTSPTSGAVTPGGAGAPPAPETVPLGSEGTPPTPRTAPPGGEVAVAHGAAARELALCSLEEVVLLAAARAESRRSGVDPRIRRAEDLITADPGAPHTVRSLAECVSLSPSRFAHLFTEQLGHSPMRALLQARLLHAARLLEVTELPVERVAAASGFGSPFHFSRVFRQRYGVPPGEYRQGLRDGD